MKLFPACALFISVAFFAATIPAAETLLEPTGLPDGAPETVLPSSAIIHVRVNNPSGLANDLDKLIMSFVPVKAVRPRLQPLLKEPQPVLAFIGKQLAGKPLTTAQLAAMFGINPDLPASLTFLPVGEPQECFVLALPMSDPNAMTKFITDIGMLRKLEKVQRPFGTLFMIESSNHSLPRRMCIACSKNMSYICGSEKAAQMLYATAPEKRMSTDPFFAKVLKDYASGDITIVVNPGVFKQFLPQLYKQYENLPGWAVEKLRSEMRKELAPGQITQINVRLRQYGVRDVDQLIDYLDCFLSAGYETLSAELLKQLNAFDGIAVSIDVGEKYQKAAISVYSKEIKPELFAKAIPMAEVQKAVVLLPGDRDSLEISGKEAPPSKIKTFDAFLQGALKRMRDKQLSAEWLAAYLKYREQIQLAASLEEASPWTLKTSFPLTADKPASEFKSISDFVEYELLRGTEIPMAKLTVIPGLGAGFVEKTYSDQVATSKNNDAAWKEYLKKIGKADDGWILNDRRFRAEDGDSVRRIILEDAYITRSGLLGYSQHELINREIVMCRDIAGFTWLQRQMKIGDNRLKDLAPKPAPIKPAVSELLALAPPDSSYIAISRALPMLIDLLNLLGNLETVAHTEMGTYLAECQKIIDANPGNPNAAAQPLSDLYVPFMIMSLHRSADGKLYCTTPGNLRFPRPKIVPLVLDLVKDYAVKADAVGGAALFTRVEPGRAEGIIIQRTDGLALLVTSAVNRFFELYQIPPDGMAKLMKSVAVEGDGNFPADPWIVYNTLWEALFQGELRRVANEANWLNQNKENNKPTEAPDW